MSNREHLFALAAATALVAFSSVARADDYSIPNTERFARSEDLARPMTCSQAIAFAWFKHQMEIPDVNDNNLPTPAECDRTRVAEAGDREVYEESK